MGVNTRNCGPRRRLSGKVRLEEPRPPEPASPPADPNAHQKALLRQALTRARCNLALVALLLTAAVGLGLHLFCAGPHLLAAEQQGLLDAAREELSAHANELIEEAGDLAEESLPPLSEALAAQLSKDAPAFMRALETEGDQLAQELAAHLQKQVDARYRPYLARQRAILHQEFPGITDPKELERLAGALEQAVDRLAQRYYVEEYRKQVGRFVTLWKAIPPAEILKARQADMEQLLAQEVQQWLLLKIFEAASAPPATLLGR
jgi:hypothetical protein